MTVLEWDKTGEKIFQAGVDRGVLFPKDAPPVVWNGLTSVDDGSDAELKSYYLDGIKFLETVTPGDFVGNLKAFTYPDAFDEIMGIASVASGLSFHEQPPKSFDLTYRTRIGNDVESIEYGYKIHLLYNLVAIPDSHTFATNAENLDPAEFSWSLTGTPVSSPGFRPTVHITIDSTDTDTDLLAALEDILYGTTEDDPRFPTLNEIRALYGAFGVLLITDNGDGTWTAEDVGEDYITMLDSTTFRIDNADATYSDADTYDISSTNL